MKPSITGLGGCREVGRSCFLLDAGEKYMFDCGIKLSPEGVEYPLPLKTHIDAAIISHAHLDHSGNLPHLFLQGTPLCHMTPPTLEIAEILWHDTLKIAGYEGTVPKFSKTEIAKAKRYSFPISYNRKVDISPQTTLEFFNAGHILGSAIAKVDFGSFSFAYTGDFKVDETRLMNKADLDMGPVDYVMMESTYGDADHPDRFEVEKAFVEKVNETIDRGGVALIPSFAVGRSQEIIDILHEFKVKCPIYLDGMGQKAALVSMKYPEYLRDAKHLKAAHKKVGWIRNNGQRMRALDQPCAIVTTAGMLEGGPILSYLKQVYNDANSSVLMTGYQVETTQGRRLLNTGEIGIDGADYRVKCEIQKFDFSAHVSQSNLLNAVKKWSPKEVFLIHGELAKAEILKGLIEEQTGITVTIPERGVAYSLDLK